MQKLFFAYPGDIDTPTGGYGYDRRIIAGLKDLGREVGLVPLGEGFPFPSEGALAGAQAALAALPAGAVVVVDGLAFGAMAKAAEALAGHLCLIALVHHPLCLENGLDAHAAEALRESERKALSFARHVIVTSPATAARVSEIFSVPADRITIVLPGTGKQKPVTRTPSDEVRLLSVGTVVPRKGYDLLFNALAGLSGPTWRLDIVGGLAADAACYEALRAQAEALGLTDRITFHGSVPESDLERYYRAADIFVLASRYEGYGMAYTEALAHGLPVIGSGGGAVRDTLPEGASIYCGTEDEKALRAALERLIGNPRDRLAMAEAAGIAAQDFPDWQDAAARFAATLAAITSDTGAPAATPVASGEKEISA